MPLITSSGAALSRAMGGIETPRKDHLIKLSKRLDEAANKYGEDVLRLLG